MPEYLYWRSLSFKEKYAYGKNDSIGIACGNRSEALKQLLHDYFGYKDFIEIQYTSVHVFLLTKLNNNQAWVCDAWSPHGFQTSAGKLDWISYLYAAKNNPEFLNSYDIPSRFGQSENLLNPDIIHPFITAMIEGDCETLETITNGKLNSENPSWNWDNRGVWFNKYLFLSENPNIISFKTVYFDSYTNAGFSNNYPGYNNINIWSNPEIQINVAVPPFTDYTWATGIISQMEQIIQPNQPINIFSSQTSFYF